MPPPEDLTAGEPLVYLITPNRSYPGAVAILAGGEFLTGSYSLPWAIEHAREHAAFDRRRGVEAEVVVLEARS
jgi:hypothetical protein